MSHYCSVCGRELRKTAGPIGPKCLQKMRPRNIRARHITKAQHNKMWTKYDMYGGNNEPEKDDSTSESSEGQEVREDGSCGETTTPEG